MKKVFVERPELKAIACAALARGRAHMGLGKPPTRLERAVERLLKKIGADFNVQYRQNGFYLDFALPHEKVAILADGCFWHCCPVHYPMARCKSQQHTLTIDKKRDRALKKAGWQVLHIMECEVNLPATLERIREVAQ
jgi:DNA mismatch endonuclease (patch repair protein)